MPVFYVCEDISIYLIRFERLADLMNMKKEGYAVKLGGLWEGKAVAVCASLSPMITYDL